MPIYDDEFDPISMADTGTPKEWTNEEVREMLEEDERRIQELELGKQLTIFLERARKDILRRQEEAEEDKTISMLDEKIMRGKPLSDKELDDVLFDLTNHLILEIITPKEFLRRMVCIAGLVELNDDDSEE